VERRHCSSWMLADPLANLKKQAKTSYSG
jgi:hypothetical protein